MVSQAAASFFISFADAYGAGVKPQQDALARAQVQKKLREDENNAMIGDMFSISKTMQNATEEERNTLKNRLNKFSSAGLQKIATVQMTGGDMFVKQGDSYGIKPLKTSNLTEADKTRKAFTDIVSALQYGDRKEKDILGVYKSLPINLKILGRKELERNMTDHQGRVSIAQNEQWITVKQPLGEDPSSLPTYSLNQTFIKSAKGIAYFGYEAKPNDTDAIRKLLYGDMVNQERAARYFRALSGSPNAQKFIKAEQADGRKYAGIIDGLDEKSIAVPEDTGRITMSTDVLSSSGFNELTNTYTQNYFENLITTLGSTPRRTVIEMITNTLVDRFSNLKYLNSDRKTAEDYIKEYIGSQFDLAMEQKVQ